MVERVTSRFVSLVFQMSLYDARRNENYQWGAYLILVTRGGRSKGKLGGSFDQWTFDLLQYSAGKAGERKRTSNVF